MLFLDHHSYNKQHTLKVVKLFYKNLFLINLPTSM